MVQRDLSEDAVEALRHIRGRTRMGKFANPIYYMRGPRWDAALRELTDAGYPLRRVHGTVADDPTVSGGWVLDTAAPDGRGRS